MSAWQFWTLIGVLVLNVLAVHSVDGSVKALWTKLHGLQEMLHHIPSADYQEDLERLGGQLERINDALRPSDQSDSDLD